MQAIKNKEKLTYLQKMAIYDDFSKKSRVIFKKFSLFFWKLLSYLICFPSFSSINSSSLSRKKYDWDIITLIHRKELRGQNTSVGIRLIELTERSDTLNYESFFKHGILQTTLHTFLLFIFVWNKIFYSKNWPILYNFLIWFGLAFDVTVLKDLCFWCSFHAVIGN